MLDATTPPTPILLYDDQCGVCRGIARWVHRAAQGKTGERTLIERPIGGDPEALRALNPGPRYLGCLCNDSCPHAGRIDEARRRGRRRSLSTRAQHPVVRLVLRHPHLRVAPVPGRARSRVRDPGRCSPTVWMRELRRTEPAGAGTAVADPVDPRRVRQAAPSAADEALQPPCGGGGAEVAIRVALCG